MVCVVRKRHVWSQVEDVVEDLIVVYFQFYIDCKRVNLSLTPMYMLNWTPVFKLCDNMTELLSYPETFIVQLAEQHNQIQYT